VLHKRIAFLGTAAAFGALASVALAGGEPPGPERTVTTDGTVVTVREMSEAWQLADVGPRARTLTLFYASGGCGHDNGRVAVEEGRTTIEIGVRQDVTTGTVGEEGVACTSDLRILRLRAQLSRPVAGRRIDGGPRMGRDLTAVSRHRELPNGNLRLLVPRTVGLAPGDAVDLLADQGFRARTTGRAQGRVVAQRPRAGRPPLSNRRGRPRAVVLTVR
jgi:hypothetical protein